jgi:hypothetical protein
MCDYPAHWWDVATIERLLAQVIDDDLCADTTGLAKSDEQ